MKEKKIRLSKSQIEIIDAMKRDEPFYKGHGAHGKYWCDNNRYSKPDANALLKNGLIKVVTGSDKINFELTELGKNLSL